MPLTLFQVLNFTDFGIQVVGGHEVMIDEVTRQAWKTCPKPCIQVWLGQVNFDFVYGPSFMPT